MAFPIGCIRSVIMGAASLELCVTKKRGKNKEACKNLTTPHAPLSIKAFFSCLYQFIIKKRKKRKRKKREKEEKREREKREEKV